VPAEKGDARLARLRTLIGRAEARCGGRATELRQAHAGLLEIARRLEPPAPDATEPAPTGAQVRARVEACLDELATACATGAVAAWLHPNLEQFYRRVKAEQRRITGHKRADAFVVRVGGFAVYATAASGEAEATLLRDLATVPAAAWQHERATLRANQARQAKMRRFRLHRAAYLADLEARWAQLAEPP
jgi:hypothetical protein